MTSEDGIIYDIFTTANGKVHLGISDRDGKSVEFEIDALTAHNLAFKLLSSAWAATKVNMGTMGETFRRLGFFH